MFSSNSGFSSPFQRNIHLAFLIFQIQESQITYLDLFFMLNVNNFNFIILNFLVIWTTRTSYYGELGLQWEKLGRRHLTYIIDVISPSLIKTSTSIPELSSCQAQQACHFSRYKRFVYLREKKMIIAGWFPWKKRNQELLNWVLPTTDSTSPNFLDTRNEEASFWYPKGEQHSPAEHHSLADVDYEFFHHVGDCTAQSWRGKIAVFLRDKQLKGEKKQNIQTRQSLVKQNCR